MLKSIPIWLLVILIIIVSVGIGYLYSQNSSQTKPVSTPVSTDQLPGSDENYNSQELEMYPQNATVFVPILMYHYIRDYHDPNDQLGIGLSVSPTSFNRQMSELKSAGYQTISLTDFANKKYGTKSVILTLDDGYLDAYQSGKQILDRYGFKATFFIVKNFVGKDRYMTQAEIDELKADGMEIGGHSTSHANLAKMEYAKETLDISASLVKTDPIFAYPSGQYSSVTLEIMDELNVNAAVTTKYGVATEKSKLLELPRMKIADSYNVVQVIEREIAVAKKGARPSPTPTSKVK